MYDTALDDRSTQTGHPATQEYATVRPRRRGQRPRRGPAGPVLVVGTALALLAGAVLYGYEALPRTVAYLVSGDECTAGSGPQEVSVSTEQAGNAATIAAVAVRRGLPRRAAAIAIATAMQESKLRNLAYGDRDSVGLFQQRPSMGWGSAAQIRDPVYAAGKFYDELVHVPGWAHRPLTEAAQ